MKIPRPNSLNGLLLVGFGLVALPLLFAVLWALFSLDRLADQSAQLVGTGSTVAERNQVLAEQVESMERVARQYVILRDSDSLALLQQDFASINATLDEALPMAEQVDAVPLVRSIRVGAQNILVAVRQPELDEAVAAQAIGDFVSLRRRVAELATMLSEHVEQQLADLQESTANAQEVAAWQAVSLAPVTLVLVLVFTFLIGRPLGQIDKAIKQLGESGFSKPIVIDGPKDLERLGRQLEWLRTRLLELAQEKNRFLRHMSHELKTPLANIREGTELLLDGSVGELQGDQREVTDILRNNGLKLQQLIENLLSFSAWQAKSETLNLSEFPFRALVISVVKAQQLTLKAVGIRIELRVADFVVSADRDKLRTVLDNLLSNAIKFTPKGGIISIAASSGADGFVLDFADSGPGIPQSERPRIFEAFFQGKQKQGGQLAGTDIGLSVVLECIQAHDGVVELVDESPFSGAHFRIRIPQQRAIGAEQRMAANG